MIARPRARPPGVDAGFSLIEVIVAIGLVATVMASMTAFLVTALSVTNQQSTRKAAVQLADDAMELVRALPGSAVLVGRDEQSVNGQFDAPVAAVAPLLSTMDRVWDEEAAPGSGPTARLPTAPTSRSLNGVSFAVHWYVGTCGQPTEPPTPPPAPTPDPGLVCTATGEVPFYRVVVAVTWSARYCPASACSEVTATLVSSAADPLFQARPPTVNDPGDQTSYRSADVSLALSASGGAAPLRWSAGGLPDGLSIDPATGVVSGRPTTLSTRTVIVRATDALGLHGDAAFTWRIITAPLTITSPLTTQSGADGAAIPALQASAVGGVEPYQWTATNLPTSLTMDTAGRITGTYTEGTRWLTALTVTDAVGETATATFPWEVSSEDLAIIKLTGDLIDEVGDNVSLVANPQGGTGPQSWSYTGTLPPGTSWHNNGEITGRLTQAGTFVVRMTVERGGQTATYMFRWTVCPDGQSDEDGCQ